MKNTLPFAGLKERIDSINPFILAILLFVAYLLLRLPVYNYTSADGDTAEYFNNAFRVINGELPYRDFWLLFPPGEVFFPAFIYKIFGLNINALLAVFIVSKAFIGLFSFILGRLIFRNNFFAVLAAALVLFNGANISYALPLLIASIFFIKYLKDNGAVKLLSSGIFFGLAFLFDIYAVAATFLAFVLTLFIYKRLNKTLPGNIIKSLAAFCLGILLVIGPVSFALREVWQIMVKEVAVRAVLHGTSINLPYFYTTGQYVKSFVMAFKGIMETGSIRSLTNLFYNLANLIIVTLAYLMPFLLGAITVRYLACKKLKAYDKIIVLFFLLWGGLAFLKAFGRSDIGHLHFPITPLFFLLIFFLQKNFFTYGIGVVIRLLLLSVPLFFFDISTALLMPHYEVSTQYGRLVRCNEAEAREINGIIDIIRKNTREGDYIFVTPWFAPPFYALTNRKNSTYYDSLIDVMARPSEEKQMKICNDLFQKDTKLIVHCSDWGFDNKKELHFLNACQILQRYIEDNFELMEKYGRYEIYISKKR